MIAKNIFPSSISTLPLSRQKANESDRLENVYIEDYLLKRRNGAKLFNSTVPIREDSYIYTYDRGDNKEAYLIIITYEDLPLGFRQGIAYVVGNDGKERVINKRNFGNSDADLDNYLQFPSDMTPKEVFKCVTVKDTTFIINRTKQVKMKPLDHPPTTHYVRKRLVWVKEATTLDGGYTYHIIIDGLSHWTKRTDTLAVTKDYDLITNSSRFGSCIMLLKGADTSVQVADTHGDQAQKLVYKEVERIEDLPQDFDNSSYEWFYYEKNDGEPYYEIYEWSNRCEDYILVETTRSEPDIELGGVKLTEPDKLPKPTIPSPNSYIIVKVKENGNGYFVEHERGKWIECADPQDDREIDNRTTPLTLYRTSDTDFSLSFMELRGKHATAPNPPFIDNYIQDIVYYNGRLGFVTADSISLSAIIEDKAINFFYTTARTELPNDPLFYGMSLSKREKVLQVGTFQYGLFIFTTNGIYINRLVADSGESINHIVKVTDFSITPSITSSSYVYYLADNRLYITTPNGQTQEISNSFRNLIKRARDLAVYPERNYLFILREDLKEVVVIKDGNTFIWSFFFDIYGLEVQEGKLILVGTEGTYGVDLLEEDNNGYMDNTHSFQSIIKLPKNLLGEGKTWLKYWYKRLEIFVTNGDYKIRVERDTDNYIINSLPNPYPNKQHVINGHNFNTDIYIESVENEPLDIELINLTLEIEPQPKRG